MVATRELAIRNLTAHPDLEGHPPMMLRLGYLAGVKEWFRAAFNDIILSPLSALRGEDCEAIGAELLYYVIQSRKRIEVLRKIVLLQGPSFDQSPSCRSGRASCPLGWRTFWDRRVVPVLLGDQQVTSDVLRQHLRNVPSLICGNCYRLNLTRLCDSGHFDADADNARYEAVRTCAKLFDARRGVWDGETSGDETDSDDGDTDSQNVPSSDVEETSTEDGGETERE